MKTYAILDSNSIVQNTIIALDIATANHCAISSGYPTAIEATTATGNPCIGLSYEDGIFEQPPTVVGDSPADAPPL